MFRSWGMGKSRLPLHLPEKLPWQPMKYCCRLYNQGIYFARRNLRAKELSDGHLRNHFSYILKNQDWFHGASVGARPLSHLNAMRFLSIRSGDKWYMICTYICTYVEEGQIDSTSAFIHFGEYAWPRFMPSAVRLTNCGIHGFPSYRGNMAISSLCWYLVCRAVCWFINQLLVLSGYPIEYSRPYSRRDRDSTGWEENHGTN